MAEISTWDELISHTDTAEDVIWTGGDLDFNEIQPHGFTETITFNAKSIDFSGATFKNIRSYAETAFSFYCSTINNLSITDMIFMPNNSNVLIKFNGNQKNICNLVITCEITNENATKIVDIGAVTVYLYSCGFNIRARSNYKVYFAGWSDTYRNRLRFIDCRFILDIEQKGKALFQDCAVMNSLISGKFIDKDGSAVSLTSTNLTGTNVYNLEGSFTYTSPKLSLYNSDLATFETSETGYIVGVTTEELKNAEILREKGFPIAVVGT